MGIRGENHRSVIGNGDGVLVVRGGQVVMAAMRENRLAELYRLDEKGEQQLTHFNDWVQEQYAVSTPKPLSFTDHEGFEIHGWIMEPAGYQPGKKYPAILNIHGGPRGAYGTVFFHEMQLWTSRGYFVIFCNPRGSSGRGLAFADLLGKYGDTDYKNLMQFADVCLQKVPDIDADNLCVTGGSYGGYMTHWIIGHTDRFKGAIAQRSISNWISMYGCTDISYFVAWGQCGTPWSNLESLWFHSPLKYADNFKTPTLLLQNARDFRCPVEQAEQMLTALIERDVPARMVLFHNASHGNMTPVQRRRNDDEVIAWLDRYVKGEQA